VTAPAVQTSRPPLNRPIARVGLNWEGTPDARACAHVGGAPGPPPRAPRAPGPAPPSAKGQLVPEWRAPVLYCRPSVKSKRDSRPVDRPLFVPEGSEDRGYPSRLPNPPVPKRVHLGMMSLFGVTLLLQTDHRRPFPLLRNRSAVPPLHPKSQHCEENSPSIPPQVPCPATSSPPPEPQQPVWRPPEPPPPVQRPAQDPGSGTFGLTWFPAAWLADPGPDQCRSGRGGGGGVDPYQLSWWPHALNFETIIYIFSFHLLFFQIYFYFSILCF